MPALEADSWLRTLNARRLEIQENEDTASKTDHAQTSEQLAYICDKLTLEGVGTRSATFSQVPGKN